MVYYFDRFLFLHTHFLPVQSSRFPLTALLLSGAMLGIILLCSQFVLAEDAVCGDSIVTDSEQCDDGNLTLGDGCSNTCDREVCGNGALDGGEQCDDGNTRQSDGCSADCSLEFCGDAVRQVLLGEQCDDGNAVDGDGCSALCRDEQRDEEVLLSSASSSLSSASSVSSSIASSLHAAASSAPSSRPLAPTLPIVPLEQFLTSPQGTEVLSFLSSDDQAALLRILRTLGQGKKLNAEEKGVALHVRDQLAQARDADRLRYSDLLTRLLEGLFSEKVALAESLDPSLLRSGSLADILASLEKRSPSFSDDDRTRLRTTLSSLPLDTEKLSFLDSDGSATTLSRLSQIVALKQELSPLASQDPEVSKKILSEQIAFLRQNAALLEQESSLSSEEFSALLDRASRLIESNDFSAEKLQSLHRNIFSSQASSQAHSAAGLPRPALTVDDPLPVSPSTQKAFRTGPPSEQVRVLRELLQDDVLQSLFVRARDHHLTELLQEYEALLGDLDAFGRSENTPRPCDDSSSAMVSCIHEYTITLQSAIRNASIFTRFIGTLQDTFLSSSK